MEENYTQETLKMVEYAKSVTAQIEAVLLKGSLTKKDQRVLSKLAHQLRRTTKGIIHEIKEMKPYESWNPRAESNEVTNKSINRYGT
jgi:hypothetical protein